MLKINREQRRRLGKKLLKVIQSQKPKYIPEGTKVQLNVEKMRKNKDWDRLTDKYKQWVNNHANDIFTVIYDKNHIKNPIVVSLKEDMSVPKWLFYIGDLKTMGKGIK